MLCRNTKTGHIYDYSENLRGQSDIEIISQLEEMELRKKAKPVVVVVEEAPEEVIENIEEVKPKKVKKSKEV